MFQKSHTWTMEKIKKKFNGRKFDKNKDFDGKILPISLL